MHVHDRSPRAQGTTTLDPFCGMAWSALLCLALWCTGSHGGKDGEEASGSRSERSWPSEDDTPEDNPGEDHPPHLGRLLWAPDNRWREDASSSVLSDLGRALETFGVPVLVEGGGADLAALLYDGRALRGQRREQPQREQGASAAEGEARSYYPGRVTRLGDARLLPHAHTAHLGEPGPAAVRDGHAHREAHQLPRQDLAAVRDAQAHREVRQLPRQDPAAVRDVQAHREVRRLPQQAVPREDGHEQVHDEEHPDTDCRPPPGGHGAHHGGIRPAQEDHCASEVPWDPAQGGGGEFEARDHSDQGEETVEEPANHVEDSNHPEDDVITGIMGDLAGVEIDGEWVSVNQLLEEFARGGNMPWIPIAELLRQAEAQFRAIREEQRALLSSASTGKVRRWGEWRPGTDRWHNQDGTKKINTPGSSSSGPTTTQARGSEDMTKSGQETGQVTGPSSSASSSSQAVGFYKGGVWHNRERTEEEKRWLAGGQGARRQEKRRARMQAWVDGQWLPSWLEQYRREKAAREMANVQGDNHGVDTDDKAEGEDETKDSFTQNEPDHTNLLQHSSPYPTRELVEEEILEDEISLMEQPGIHGGEIGHLDDG